MVPPQVKSGITFLQRQVAPAVVAFVAAVIVARTGLGERFEHTTLDELTRRRAVLRPVPASDELLIVGIDEASLRQFDQWPWKRSIHGDFMQLLGAVVEPVGPTVVGWDLLFPEAAPDDADFVAGIKSSGLDVVHGAERAKASYGILPGTGRRNLRGCSPCPA